MTTFFVCLTVFVLYCTLCGDVQASIVYSIYTIQSQIISNVLFVPPGRLNAVDPLSALNQ